MRHKTTTLAVAWIILTTATGCGYNSMVTMKENIDAAWAQVENQLQRRNDLIPNLVETTKGYATHEQKIFTDIAEARSRLIGAGSRDAKIDAANDLGSALSRLLVIAEQYPNLKADQQFARLSDELAGTENRIATERRRFNEAVREYNTYIKTIPADLHGAHVRFQGARSTSRRRRKRSRCRRCSSDVPMCLTGPDDVDFFLAKWKPGC